MRGEETEALGVFELPLATRSEERMLLIMPGTHSKHLAIAERAIRDFRTFMTGELFDVVSAHTILRYSVAPLGETVALLNPDHLTAFRAGVEHARRLPLAAALFRVRTRQLLDQAAPETNRAFLSGTLIGAELAHLAGQRQADETIVLAAGRCWPRSTAKASNRSDWTPARSSWRRPTSTGYRRWAKRVCCDGSASDAGFFLGCPGYCRAVVIGPGRRRPRGEAQPAGFQSHWLGVRCAVHSDGVV